MQVLPLFHFHNPISSLCFICCVVFPSPPPAQYLSLFCRQFNDLAKAAIARGKRIEVTQMLRFSIDDLVAGECKLRCSGGTWLTLLCSVAVAPNQALQRPCWPGLSLRRPSLSPPHSNPPPPPLCFPLALPCPPFFARFLAPSAVESYAPCVFSTIRVFSDKACQQFNN
jgi:hypothetical protein